MTKYLLPLMLLVCSGPALALDRDDMMDLIREGVSEEKISRIVQRDYDDWGLTVSEFEEVKSRQFSDDTINLLIGGPSFTVRERDTSILRVVNSTKQPLYGKLRREQELMYLHTNNLSGLTFALPTQTVHLFRISDQRHHLRWFPSGNAVTLPMREGHTTTLVLIPQDHDPEDLDAVVFRNGVRYEHKTLRNNVLSEESIYLSDTVESSTAPSTPKAEKTVIVEKVYQPPVIVTQQPTYRHYPYYNSRYYRYPRYHSYRHNSYRRHCPSTRSTRIYESPRSGFGITLSFGSKSKHTHYDYRRRSSCSTSRRDDHHRRRH